MFSTEVLVVLLVVTWLAGGLVAAVAMRRSGGDFGIWLGVGIVLGPFAAWLALDRLRHLPVRAPLSAEEFHPGPLDILVGIDGSASSVAAAQTALGLLGDDVTSLTFVMVLDHEASGAFSGIGAQSQAYARLAAVAEEIGCEPDELKVLYGRPAAEIAGFAREAGIELIVVGARGHGLTEAMFGSVTGELIRSSSVPVLVGPSVSEPSRAEVI